MRWTRGEYGSKKAQPDVAVGQYEAGALSRQDPRSTTSAAKKNKFR
jgi:hypothetical protein